MNIDVTQLYASLAAEVAQQNYFMREHGTNVLEIPEIAFVHLVWRRLIRDQQQIFRNCTVRGAWEGKCDGIERCDLAFELKWDSETAWVLFEFKIRDRLQSYRDDLEKLAYRASTPQSSRRFFVALVDERPVDIATSGRLLLGGGWTSIDGNSTARPVVAPEDFAIVPTRDPDDGKSLRCVIGLWEVVRKSSI